MNFLRLMNNMATVVTMDDLREIQLRDARAGLSAVVDDAANGTPSVITKHGKPAAVVLGFAEWQKLSKIPSFGRLLMAAPIEAGDLPARDTSPARLVDF